MTNQLTMLLGPAGAFAAPPHNGTDTSEAAAEALPNGGADLRERALWFIAQRGNLGATCDEVEQWMGVRYQTASARINELHRAELIVDSGERRKTRSGRTAKVWTARKAVG